MTETPVVPLAIDDLTERDIAKTIDHSLLRPDLGDRDIEEGCRLAVEYDVATVCVRPTDVARARRLVDGSQQAGADRVSCRIDEVERPTDVRTGSGSAPRAKPTAKRCASCSGASPT